MDQAMRPQGTRSTWYPPANHYDQPQGQWTGRTGPSRDTWRHYIREHHPVFDHAAEMIDVAYLERAQVAVTGRPPRRPHVDNDGIIWPPPESDFQPFDRKKAVFMKVGDNGRFQYTGEVIRHFQDRCAACGLRGHRSRDPVCHHHQDKTTSTLCTNCRAGFHPTQTCKYPRKLADSLN